MEKEKIASKTGKMPKTRMILGLILWHYCEGGGGPLLPTAESLYDVEKMDIKGGRGCSKFTIYTFVCSCPSFYSCPTSLVLKRWYVGFTDKLNECSDHKMQNQAAVEALYSATFVEDYLDYVENVPDDIQRIHTRLRELDMKQHQVNDTLVIPLFLELVFLSFAKMFYFIITLSNNWVINLSD